MSSSISIGRLASVVSVDETMDVSPATAVGNKQIGGGKSTAIHRNSGEEPAVTGANQVAEQRRAAYAKTRAPRQAANGVVEKAPTGPATGHAALATGDIVGIPPSSTNGGVISIGKTPLPVSVPASSSGTKLKSSFSRKGKDHDVQNDSVAPQHYGVTVRL
jgi:hypothetical protein